MRKPVETFGLWLSEPPAEASGIRQTGRFLSGMAKSDRAEILDVARRFLVGSSTDPGAGEITVPEFHEINEVFAVALRDAGYEFETVIESLAIAELAADRASVHALQRLVPTGRKTQEQRHELTVQLVKREGWKVRDVVRDGHSVAERLHPVLVEPGEADGISIRGWARTEPDGSVFVAIVVHNGSTRPWRVKCVGAAWQKGRHWFLSQVLWKLLLLGNDFTCDPGSERALLLAVPAKVERIWLRASRPGRLRWPLFALSWAPASLAASAAPFRWNKPLTVRVAANALPLVGLAVLIAIFASVSAGLAAVGLFTAVLVLDTHWCVYRLQRKLARFRAQTAA